MNILVGVCGSISAYKTFDLTRNLVKKGHNVRVILTKGAKEFVNAQVYRYLGIEEVYESDSDFLYPKSSNDPGTVLHIELAKWADRFMICPLSANTLSSLAMGRATDLLTSTYLAFDQEKPVLLYPAMNTLMYEHPLTQANLDLVQRLSNVSNTFVMEPDSGMLACGDMGAGKLPDIEKIAETFDLFEVGVERSEKIVITTGATLAPIDPVRFITNSSSGLTGYLLAKQALKEGYKVTVLAGVHATKKLEHLLIHPNFDLKRVTTTTQMRDLALEEVQDAKAYISSAALCDFEFDYADNKLKKKDSGNTLEFKEAPDVLKEVIAQNLSGLSVIGFAAETNLTEQMLQEKWNRKPVSLLIGTHVNSGLMRGSQKGFGEDSAKYTFFNKHGVSFDGSLSKAELAKYIIGNVNQ